MIVSILKELSKRLDREYAEGMEKSRNKSPIKIDMTHLDVGLVSVSVIMICRMRFSFILSMSTPTLKWLNVYIGHWVLQIYEWKVYEENMGVPNGCIREYCGVMVQTSGLVTIRGR